ncbi:MAG: ABC transporter permease [Egibacteraceae bacterium]
MWKLVVVSLRLLYRNKEALLWALAFPASFAVVFGLFDLNKPPEAEVAIVPTSSPVSAQLVAGLREVDGFTVSDRANIARARADLGDGKVDVVVAGPLAGQPGDAELVQVLYDGGDPEINRFALPAIERLVDGMNLRLAGVEAPPLSLQQEAVAGKTVTYYDFLLPGLVAMGVMHFSIVGTGVGVARYREQRILRRLLATPLRPVRFVAAYVIAHLVLAAVQAALILGIGVLLFGARVYGNVAWILLLSVVGNLVFLNLGFVVAGRAANSTAAQGVGSAVSIPMMILSGVFFSTDTLPPTIRSAVEFLPLTPLIDALRKVAIDGLSIADTAPQLALLGAWIVGSFLIATLTFRFADGR